jgi:hypothetical protein
MLAIFFSTRIHAFCTPSSSLRLRPKVEPIGARTTFLFGEQGGRDQDSEGEEDEMTLDELLDSPFFDPDAVTKDDPAPIRWFADLVKNDYAAAETLYAGALFVALVVLSQELLRMQIYGEGYVPFQAGVKPGQLF